MTTRRRAESPTLALRLQRLRRAARQTLEIFVDGDPVNCFEGETIAVALLADRGVIGRDRVRPHGLWCGIGTCFECVVTVDGSAGVRACMTFVRPEMRVETMINDADARVAPGADAGGAGRDRGGPR